MSDIVAAQVANALYLLGLDLALFPLDHPALPTCAGRHRPDQPCDSSRGKHPCPWSWSRDSTSNPIRVSREFGRGLRNVGVDCGKSGLLVIDEDAPGEFARAAAAVGEVVPDTFTVATGKGFHYWFHQPADLPHTNRRGRFREYAIDVRGRGGYVVGPGSVHQTGRFYEAANWATPILPVPAWVETALAWTPPAPLTTFRTSPRSGDGGRGALAGVIRFVLAAPPNTRNDRLFWGSLRLWERVRAGQLTAAAAEGMLGDAAAAIRLGPAEASTTIRSARKAVLGG